MRARIADRFAHAMIEQDFGPNVMWGDGFLSDLAGGLVKGKMSRHPLDRMTAMLNALERAPDLFEKRYIRGGDCKGRNRLVRGFKLIGTPRPITPAPTTQGNQRYE